ncbi:hypothetical protein SAMN05216249_11099 [Acetitomaculum ruminis DSM 5522]|uniref:Pre-peptidase C-terminal domain-containing protein n=1 Tax=Acetitomaculum ruminis DSM 5522 TaxID=1120918 RepID=A0A1I0YL69_9FIRM|nr:hypothetical protein [Acetitomaculum ruminis]SFB14155.1 hypothetical protein SAMN05216249_11099 [Acetitomaculum ruminis DSM 5522]
MRLKKLLISCVVVVFVSVMSIIVSNAQIIKETESNDTFETAEEIEANYETAAQVARNNIPGRRTISGQINEKDADWFKVYLHGGEQYVTVNGEKMIIEVYDSNKKRILYEKHTKTKLGVTAFPFKASANGYYYVKISINENDSISYKLLVGGITYDRAICEVSLDTINMTKKHNSSSVFDLVDEKILPANALVDSISMRGIRTTAVNDINVINNVTLSLDRYIWKKQEIISRNIPLKSLWRIEYVYYKDISFNPSIEFVYIYPVKSSCVDNEIKLRK